MLIDAKTWQAWRVKMGASKRDARNLYREYCELVRQLPTDGKVRVLKIEAGQTFEQALARFLDRMPRKPYAFLARVAAIEAKRARLGEVATRKAINRERYRRQYERRGKADAARKV